jgi:hypothetical protein
MRVVLILALLVVLAVAAMMLLRPSGRGTARIERDEIDEDRR